MTTIATAAPEIPVSPRSPIPGGLFAAVAGPAALAASNVCFAVLTFDGHAEDASDHLALVGDNPGLVEAGSALGLIACLFIVPAIWAVAARLHLHRPRLAAAGGWLMGSGYVMGVALSVESLGVLSVSQAAGDPSAFIDAVDNHMSATSMAMYGVFGLGALLGGLVLGVAMLRSPGVPRWCGLALIASEPVRVVGLLTGVDLLTAVASVLILVAFVGVLRR